MKNSETNKKIIDFLNYKDILIILFLWYLMAVIITIFKEIAFQDSLITSFFHFLFIISGRFIFLSLLIMYLTSLYPINFKEMGLNFNNLKKQIFTSLNKFIFLVLLVIIIINMPISYLNNYDINALYHVNGMESLINIIIPFFLIFLACLFIALSEQFILNVIIFELFKHTMFNFFTSLVLASLFYSIILLTLNPPRILINFIIAIISILIYSQNQSIIAPAIFMAAYYASYIVFIYGWTFIRY